jgi:cysteine desulfurase
MEPSHVLAAMGVPVEMARGALRLTLGHSTTAADVDRAAEVIVAAVERIRRFASRSTQASTARP